MIVSTNVERFYKDALNFLHLPKGEAEASNDKVNASKVL